MSDPRANLHEGVPWRLEFDPTTGGYIPCFSIVSPDGESSFYDNAVLTIDYVHYKVHQGDTFQATLYSGSVANNGSMDIIISLTGTAEQAHIEWAVASGGTSEVRFYEGVTGSNYGGVLLSHNLNRDSNKTPTIGVFQNPTITVDGLLLFNFLNPGGAGGNAQGGEFRLGTEHILAPGKRYRLVAYNRAGTAQPMSVGVQWYEED